MVKSLNGRAAAHTLFTELDDQKLFVVIWLRLRAQLHLFHKLSYFFKSIIKIFQVRLSPK